MNTNRQWLLAKRPHGIVTKENFEYTESPIPEPSDGQVLVRNLLLSFDPTQRGWMEDRESYLPPVQIGEPDAHDPGPGPPPLLHSSSVPLPRTLV